MWNTKLFLNLQEYDKEPEMRPSPSYSITHPVSARVWPCGEDSSVRPPLGPVTQIVFLGLPASGKLQVFAQQIRLKWTKAVLKGDVSKGTAGQGVCVKCGG